MKVVVDTNVFIKALFFNEKWARRLMQEESMKLISFVMSEATKSELCKTIIYIGLEKGLTLEEFKPAFIALTNCLSRTNLVTPRKCFDISEHKADNKFIDCAVVAESKYIVTEDDHLLAIQEFSPTGKKNDIIKMMSPYQFFIEYNALKLKTKWK